MAPSPIVKTTFEEALPEITKIVQSRRRAWTYTSVVEWADISQDLLLRIFEKWPLYNPAKGNGDPSKRLEKWANTVISNAILNAKRDKGGARWGRPCVGGGKSNGKSCVYNSGGTTCTFTKSGKQCAECPLYKEWQKTREHQFNIKSTLALENHVQEVSNTQGDFFDVAAMQREIHAQMKENLTSWEYRIYTCIYIRHLSPIETTTVLDGVVKTWKRAPREEEQTNYQFVLSKQRWFKELMFDILKREGYDLEACLNYEQ